MANRHRHHQPPPDWFHDFLIECWDELDGPLPQTKADPSEAVATRPSRGRPRQHKQRQAHQP